MAGYQTHLTDEDKLKKQEIQQGYADLGTQAQQGIDQSYAPVIAGQKSQLAALPGQYDELRHQNDYELEVASRRFNDMMAMEGQQNAGLNRTEQAGLLASHSQTSGDIAVQQKAAEQEIQNAIAQILAEREQAKSDAALQYQTMGLQAAQDFENNTLANYRDDYWTERGYQHDIDMSNLSHQQQLEYLAVQQEYNKEMAAIDQEYALGRISAEEASTLRIQADAARLEKESMLFSAQVAQAYGGTDSGSDIEYGGFADLGSTAGLNIAAQLGYYDPSSKTFSYGEGAAGELGRLQVAQQIFNSFYYATPKMDGDTWVPDYQSTIGGDEQSIIAFSNAMAAAGLGDYTGRTWMAKLAQNQIDSRI